MKGLVIFDLAFAAVGAWACWWLRFPQGYDICASIAVVGLLIPMAVRTYDRMKGATMRRFLRDRRGATSIEYGLIAVLISVAAAVMVGNVGANVSRILFSVATQWGNADGTATTSH